MSDRHLPAPRSAATPAAAFERELDRAERYAQSALAPSTRRAYEQDWLLFATWCAERGVVAIPAQPVSVAAFLAAEADRGFRPVTIGRRAAAPKFPLELAVSRPPGSLPHRAMSGPAP